MRVLVTATDVHCWLPAGQFTIHATGEVTWRTPYDPMKDFARHGDDDVVVVPGDEGGLPLGDTTVVDVLVLDDVRAAVVRRDPARLEIVERSTGAVLDSLPLTGSGPRVPTLRDEEEWSDEVVDFDPGYGTRGIRMAMARGGVTVTARDSGHIARCDLPTRALSVVRVPGVPENTYYALDRGGAGLLVGIKWNGRHCQLISLAADGTVQGEWPRLCTDVAWGMPAPVQVGEHVITYSDEGPHRGELALLDAVTLEELDHVKLPSWPADAHAHGERFAMVSGQHVVIGGIENGRLVVQIHGVEELMDRAGLEPPPRATSATADGRGTRLWLPHEIAWLGYDGDVPLIARMPDRATVALEPEGERLIIAGSDRPASIWDAPTVPTPQHVRGGRLLTTLGARVSVLDLVTQEVVTTFSLDGVRKAWLVGDGVFHVRETKDDDDAWVLSHGYTATGRPTRELSRSSATFAPREVFTIAGTTIGWGERGPEGLYTLCRWTIGAAGIERVRPTTEPRAMAIHDGTLHVLMLHERGGHQGLYRLEGERFVELAGTGLPYFLAGLAVTDTHAYSIEPITHGADGIMASRLYGIELTTGIVSILSTSTVGQLSDLHVASGELRWYESGAGETALCRLAI